jgi:hypothetical protein
VHFIPATAYAPTLCSMPRGQSSGHRALAHLLAALSIATPKQAKEPILPGQWIRASFIYQTYYNENSTNDNFYLFDYFLVSVRP